MMRVPQGRMLVLASLALAASASALYANHSWGGYHWARTSNPFTVKLGDNLTTSTWKSHLGQTSTDWNKSTVLDTTIVTGQAKGRCRPTLGRDEICNGTYGNNGWLGLAQIWLSGGHISQGTVKVNDSYFMNQAEQEHVMCQEVGHTFGLDHQSTDGSSLNTCMDYYHNASDSDLKSTTPNQHDYDELATIYAHLDSTNSSFRPMPAAMRDLDLATPAQWGQLVKGSREEGRSVYVQNFGGGHQIVTFVTWARPENAPQE